MNIRNMIKVRMWYNHHVTTPELIRYPDLGLLVSLSHDVLEGGSDHGALELLGAAGPLLGHVLLQSLLVLPGGGWLETALD